MSHAHKDGWAGFVRSRIGIVLIAILGVVLLLTLWEHQGHVFTENVGLILLVLLCPLMYLFMHGGHGGHGHDGDSTK